MHLVALQSNANVISARQGRYQGLELGRRGDPFQDRAIFTATKTANERGDMLRRFPRANAKGAKDFHDSLTAPDERPKDGSTAAPTIALIAKWGEQSPEQVRGGIAYIDPALRVNVADVLRQIAWYKSQGMLKADADGNQIIDSATSFRCLNYCAC
jgi:NitT/TauT family transport system substrate-binding protein